MSYRFADRLRTSWSCSQGVSKLVWHVPLLCVQWKTPDGGQRNCPKRLDFYSKNKFQKSLHLVGFIIRIYDDGRSPERQIRYDGLRIGLPGQLTYICGQTKNLPTHVPNIQVMNACAAAARPLRSKIGVCKLFWILLNAENVKTTVLYNCVFPDYGPKRPGTCTRWSVVTLLWL